MHKRPIILVHFEWPTSKNQSPMLRYSSDTSNLIHVYIEGLNAAIVENAPNFHGTFRICRYETVQWGHTIHTYKGVLVTI
jgi:hypothetical protein